MPIKTPPMHLGVCQLPVLSHTEELSARLKALPEVRPALWVLPELFIGGFDYPQKDRWIRKTKDALELLSNLARESGNTYIGSLWSAAGSSCFNSLYCVSGDGPPRNIYSKQHLFPGSEEPDRFTPGTVMPEPVTLPWLTVGFAICYDLRFPEVFRFQNPHNPDLFVLSAQWPQSRIKHWITLCKARAVENQCYVLACNGSGSTPFGDLGGNSCCISPWGETLFQLGAEPDFAWVLYDPKAIRRARDTFNSRTSPVYRVSADKG